jgi:hypothetical protein
VTSEAGSAWGGDEWGGREHGASFIAGRVRRIGEIAALPALDIGAVGGRKRRRSPAQFGDFADATPSSFRVYRQDVAETAVSPRGRRASWTREVMASLAKMFRRCESIVLGERKSCAATSLLDSPSATIRAIWTS